MGPLQETLLCVTFLIGDPFFRSGKVRTWWPTSKSCLPPSMCFSSGHLYIYIFLQTHTPVFSDRLVSFWSPLQGSKRSLLEQIWKAFLFLPYRRQLKVDQLGSARIGAYHASPKAALPAYGTLA